MTIDEKIRDIMHATVEDIRERMDAAGVNASGRTRASLQVRRVGECNYQIIQYGSRVAPFGTIEHGRKAGKVPYQFRAILEQWSRDKGLTFEKESDRRRFAYFLAKKIAEQGSPRVGIKNPRPLNILDPVMAKANRDIRIVTSDTMTGVIGAHMRYAVDSIKIGMQKAVQRIKSFFKWG